MIDAVFAGPSPAGVEIVRDAMATDGIWTYERAPGRRAVFPWQAAGLPGVHVDVVARQAGGLPGGFVQVDVVFGERLADPDLRMSIPVADGGCVSVRAASPAQSLAWKLLWLSGDMHAQGKDLYDAVLLAERFPLPVTILEETISIAGEDWLSGTAAEFVEGWEVDWANFQAQYPWIVGDESQWLNRLEVAIGPTFGELGSVDQGRGGFERSTGVLAHDDRRRARLRDRRRPGLGPAADPVRRPPGSRLRPPRHRGTLPEQRPAFPRMLGGRPDPGRVGEGELDDEPRHVRSGPAAHGLGCSPTFGNGLFACAGSSLTSGWGWALSPHPAARPNARSAGKAYLQIERVIPAILPNGLSLMVPHDRPKVTGSGANRNLPSSAQAGSARHRRRRSRPCLTSFIRPAWSPTSRSTTSGPA